MTTRGSGRHEIEVSNEDKVFFPEDGITKGALIDYYERIADYLLPHLEGRPLVVQRFPDGIGGDGFYQKQASSHFPDWIRTVEVRLAGSDGTQDLVVCDGKDTLVYLANQACLVLHPWLSRSDALDRPDLLVVDLDPPRSGDFNAVRRAARQVKGLFEDLDLPCFLKLTGSKGVHVVVPLDGSDDFDAVRSFGQDAVTLLTQRQPDALTTEQRKAKRHGRVFLDVARNAYGQTAVAPYSVRPLPGAPVAAPVDWDELGRVGPQHVTIENVFRRLAQWDDPWDGLRRHARSLRRRIEALQEMAGR
jgi:bifunctional non-homologous end joining protein LigD